MSKIVWLGASTVRAIDYGGVAYQQTFAYLTSQFYGYDMVNGYVNAGVDGNGSTEMLARLQTDVIAQSPTVCVVNAGGLGDQFPPGGGASIPIATYRSNIVSIFSQLQTARIKVVAVNDVLERGSVASFQGLQPYMQAYEEIAQQKGIPNVDIYREFALQYILDLGTPGAFDALYVDGVVHQTVAGNTWISTILTRPRYAGVF